MISSRPVVDATENPPPERAAAEKQKSEDDVWYPRDRKPSTIPPRITRSHCRSRSLAELPLHSRPDRYVVVNNNSHQSDRARDRMASLNKLTTVMDDRRCSPELPSPVLAPHPHPPPLPPAAAFPRMNRQRSSSPLHFQVVAGGGLPSSPSSPVSFKYNESYPSASSTSSLPSTPRSRSPSISSLETIPDVPDAEAAAAGDGHVKAEEDANNNKRRGQTDAAATSSPPTRIGMGRKRWSVCGAERIQDLDLETIWED